MRLLRIAAFAAVAILCAVPAARANKLVTITLPDRAGEIPAKNLTYQGPPRADVLLPDGYSRKRAYPLIVLLPGFSNTYKILEPGMLDAKKVLAGLQAIVVAPEGEVGWYTDWFNNGAYGTPQWESYILDEALPQILARYRIRKQRRYHALFGVSMGGFGAAYLGGRLPGFFGSVGVLSGFVDTQLGVIGPQAQDLLSGAAPGSVVGPTTGFYADGHNPAKLAENLKYTRLFVSAGNGLPRPDEGTGGGVGNVEEAGVIRPMSDAYVPALRDAGVDVTYQTHVGCHCWPTFQEELRQAIRWDPFAPVIERSAQWTNKTVATHGRLWGLGYRFDAHPTDVVRFIRAGRRLQISAAGTGVTLKTPGGCSLHVATPADLRLPRRCPQARAAAARAAPRPFGHACATQQPSGVRFCPTPDPTQGPDARVKSWDGAPLQVDVTLPPTGNGPWPTIVMLPGFGGAPTGAVSWEGNGNAGAEFSNAGFAKRGYAVVTMNFRGVGYSCGNNASRTPACKDVTFEFADQRYDARDVQWLLGQLVDEGIAQPRALGVTGESLGSLVTLEMALLYDRIRLPGGGFAPWLSPAGRRLHVAATYPIWALSDLLDGAAPNGRFVSSDPATAANDRTPIGVIKGSLTSGIAAETPVNVWTLPTAPDGFDLFLSAAYVELAAPDGPGADSVAREFHDYHQSIGTPAGSAVAPILMQDGWNDMWVGGALQALRLVGYLHEVAPRAKVALQLADVGHALSSNKPADVATLNRQAFAFFAHYLQRKRGGPAPGTVTALTVTCPASARSAGPFRARGMAALAPRTIRFASAPAQLVAGGGDPAIAAALDPVVLPSAGSNQRCTTFTPGSWPGTAVYTQPVTRTFTMLGLPTLRFRIATAGANGQLDARLWDVGPDGRETYVTRGTYALTGNQSGDVTWQLWGGGWTFAKGHTIRVEILASDAPTERPSNRPFSATISNLSVALPARF